MPAVQPTPLTPEAHPDDAQWVVRAQGGEDFAFDMLYRRHVQFVAAVAVRLGQRSDVDDLVQETFITAFRELKQLTQPAAFRGWLARITVSKVHRRRRFWRVFRFFRDEADERATLESMVSSEASPEVRAQLGRVDTAVSRLPEPIRAAWVLRFVLGCTLEEVATGCSCSLATAKRRLTSASNIVNQVVTVEMPE